MCVKELDAGHSLAGRADYVKGADDNGSSDGVRVLSVDGIVLYEAACVVKGEDGVVDGHKPDIGVVLEGGAVNEAANMAKPVYSNFDSHR